MPPEDPAALAGAVTALLADRELRESLGRQAREHVRAERDVRGTAAAVAALYRELLGSPRHAGAAPGGAEPEPGETCAAGACRTRHPVVP